MRVNGKQMLVGAMSALVMATSIPTPALAAEVAGLGLQESSEQAQAQLDEVASEAKKDAGSASTAGAEQAGTASTASTAESEQVATVGKQDAGKVTGASEAETPAVTSGARKDEKAGTTAAAAAAKTEPAAVKAAAKASAAPAKQADDGIDVTFVIQGLPEGTSGTTISYHMDLEGFIPLPNLNKEADDPTFGNTDPKVDGYTWVGRWYTDAACTKPFNATRLVTSDLTLYTRYDGPTAPTAPAFNLSTATSNPYGVDVTADGSTNSYSIYKYTATAGDPYQDADGNWCVDVSIDPAKALNSYLPVGLAKSDYELDTAASKLTATFRTEGANGTTYKLAWKRDGGDQARIVFKKKASAPAFSFADDAQWDAQNVRYTVEGGNFDGTDYSNSTTIGFGPATAGEPYRDADGTWKVDVALDAAKADFWFPGAQADVEDYELDRDASQLTATYTWTGKKWECMGNARANLVFKKKAVAPAVDVSQLLNTYGTVFYKVEGGTQGGSAPYLDAVKVGATAGTPEKQEDGTWRVTLTLEPAELAEALLVHSWELPDGTTAEDFQVDRNASTLTATFETNGAGTSWYLVPGQGIKVAFVKKESAPVAASVHVFYGFKNDDHPTSDGEVVYMTANVGDKLSSIAGWQEAPVRDGYTFKGWNTKADGTGDAVTGETVIPSAWFAVYAQWEANGGETPERPSKPDQGDQTTPEQKPEGPAQTVSGKRDDADGTISTAKKKASVKNGKTAAREKTPAVSKKALPQTGDDSGAAMLAAGALGVAALAAGGYQFARRRTHEEE